MVDIYQTQQKNTDVLSNSVELTVAVISRIAGNEVSTTLNGANMTARSLAELAAARIQTRFAADLAKGVPTNV